MTLKFSLLIPLLAAFAMSHSEAQSRIFRCGNTYTNDPVEAKNKDCKLVETVHITVVEGTSVKTSAPAQPRVASAPQAAQPQARVDNADQRARDADARLILDSELKKAEARHAELLKEFNNGQPEKLGPETRNHQKYLDRVAELKASIARTESDISGIRRELGRVAPAAAASR